MEPREDPPLVAKLRSLLNRSARIEVTDGRVFIGHFMCIDHSKNIILSGTYEYQPSSAKLRDSNSNCQDMAAIAAGIGSANVTIPIPKPGILKSKEEEGIFLI
ncbi:hypothetical protein BGZ76_004244 [Entomortierella beljakovae]|nr:hypothetical protein BGZ76_004244 [Entomortierella beljakovae]